MKFVNLNSVKYCFWKSAVRNHFFIAILPNKLYNLVGVVTVSYIHAVKIFLTAGTQVAFKP